MAASHQIDIAALSAELQTLSIEELNDLKKQVTHESNAPLIELINFALSLRSDLKPGSGDTLNFDSPEPGLLLSPSPSSSNDIEGIKSELIVPSSSLVSPEGGEVNATSSLSPNSANEIETHIKSITDNINLESKIYSDMLSSVINSVHFLLNINEEILQQEYAERLFPLFIQLAEIQKEEYKKNPQSFSLELAQAQRSVSLCVSTYIELCNSAIYDRNLKSAKDYHVAACAILQHETNRVDKEKHKKQLQELGLQLNPNTQTLIKKTNLASLSANSSIHRITKLSVHLEDCKDPDVLFQLAKIAVREAKKLEVDSPDLQSAYYLAQVSKLLMTTAADKVRVESFIKEKKLDTYLFLNDCKPLTTLGIQRGIQGAPSAKELYEKYAGKDELAPWFTSQIRTRTDVPPQLKATKKDSHGSVLTHSNSDTCEQQRTVAADKPMQQKAAGSSHIVGRILGFFSQSDSTLPSYEEGSTSSFLNSRGKKK